MRHPSSSSSLSETTAPKTPCCVKVGLKKGPWTPEEDELLSNYINREGEGRWRTLPKRAGLLRCGKSCRLRWMNYLRPNVKRGQIAPDEEDLILRLHRLLGNRWSLIAARIPGRTDNEIKNYWNTHLSKKLISQGIDPRTHKPLENITTSSTTDNNNNNNAINNINTVKVVVTPSSSKSVVNQIHQQEQPFNDPSSSASIIDLEAERIRRGYTYTGHGQLAQFRRNIGDVEFTSSGGGGIENILSNPQGLMNHAVNNDVNYCSDDVFSSFLNSLINDQDVFSSIQHVQHQPSGFFSPAAPADGFEAPTTLLSYASAFNHKDPETTHLNHHPA